MSEIKRFEPELVDFNDFAMTQYPNGDWVTYEDHQAKIDSLQAALAASPTQEPIAEKAAVWFNALSRIATLLEMPEDQPIIQAVDVLENLLKQPAQEPVGEVQHYAAPANLPAYVNMKWYGKPPKNGTKVYLMPVKQESWMPIETAPKDGTEILLVSAVMGDMAVCYWRSDATFTGWTWGLGKAFNNPVKWMPLPLPPVEVKQESKPTYSGVVCRGCWELGSACGKCEKCEATKPTSKR